MTVRVMVSCDGRRNREPCRGWFTAGPISDSPHAQLAIARRRLADAGWRPHPHVPGQHLCPSHGHDEEPAG